MKKYHFAICVLLLISINTYLHSQSSPWENISNQIPGDSLNNLSDVIVVDRFTGYIASSSEPEIYRSDFWAGTWETIQTPSPVTAIYFMYYDLGFICGTDSNLYLTDDAGEHWIYFSSLGEKINDINLGYDIYNLKGYICGDNGTIGLIDDTSLAVIQSGYSTNFVKLTLPYNNKVWLVGDSSVYSYDGNTFTKQFTSVTTLNSVYFWNELNGWVVGDSGYIAKTSDGGNTWFQKQNPDTLKRNLNDIYFVNSMCFTVGNSGLILETYDGDNWWIETSNLTEYDLVGVHIAGGGVESGPGLAVGENKTALLYPIVVSVDDKPGPADNFNLYQNYPNPFNPTTKIRYKITEPGFVSLKIFDVIGNEIVTLVDEEKPAGDYEIEFNANELPSGVYVYQLQTGSFIKTRKMVYLK